MRVALPGAAGKMGAAVARVIAETSGVELAALIERAGHPLVGQPMPGAPSGLLMTSDLDAALARADVAIDFTMPAASAALATAAAARGVALVVGTTGLNIEQRSALHEAARRVPVVFSPNMSVGVNVLLGLLDTAARALASASAMDHAATRG